MSVRELPAAWRGSEVWGKIKWGDTAAGRILFGLLALSAVFLLFWIYSKMAWTVPINSDHASILLEADDVRHGNVLLHGWTLTALTFYTTDLPFYVLGLALCGFSPALLREVPALIYALTVFGSVLLAGRGTLPERRHWGMLTAFVLLGLPSLLVPEIMLVGVNHIGTTLFMVVTLLALDRAEREKHETLRLTAFGLLLALTVFGDSMAVVVLLVPLCLVSLVRLVHDRRQWNAEQKILLPALAAFLLSRIAVAAISLAGGFKISDPAMRLTYLELLPRNVLVTVKSLLGLYRANFFGTEIGLGTAGLLIGLLGLGFVLYSLRHGMILWISSRAAGDRINQVLTAAMAINLLAYLLDYNVVFYMNTLYSPPERYLVPFFVFGAVLAGRLGVAHVPDLRRFQFGLAALALAYTGFFVQQLSAPAIDQPAVRLGRWLQSRGLTYGYGNFWCANIVTATSGSHVQVRAVSADTEGHIGQMYWFSKHDWYRNRPAHFLVFDAAHYHGRKFYWTHVDMAAARKSFGTPDDVEQVGQYTILVWNKDITPELVQRGLE